MKSGPTEIAVFQWLAAVGAIVAAFAVGYIAHNDFGISLQEIRVLAAIGMSTIAALLAIEFFGRKLRKSKR
jgi:undecaprenyl pyrophosphate phosphatase UppP